MGTDSKYRIFSVLLQRLDVIFCILFFSIRKYGRICYFFAGKTLSVRCIVESVPSSQFWDTSQTSTSNGQVELKRTVDVPTHTVMYNLVDEVLQKFGYPKEIALTARGEYIFNEKA